MRCPVPDGWFDALTRALLDVAVSHGMLLDEDTLASMYGRQLQAASS